MKNEIKSNIKMPKHTLGKPKWKIIQSKNCIWGKIKVASHRYITVEGRDREEAYAIVALLVNAPKTLRQRDDARLVLQEIWDCIVAGEQDELVIDSGITERIKLEIHITNCEDNNE